MSKKSKTKNRKIPKRRELKAVGGRAQVPLRMNRRQSDDYYEALDLYEHGNFESAEEILLELDRKGAYIPVIELLCVVHFQRKQYNKAAIYAKRLLRLAPEDVEARLKYAYAAMYEGYATIAMNQFLEIERRSPNHDLLREIKDLLIIVKEETEKRIATAGFPSGSVGLQLQGLHEESLLAMGNNQFEEVIGKCEQILAISPEFWSARNNLAMANFHAGNVTTAIEILETTTRLHPGNRFAAVLLAKLKFLTGNLERPQELLNELLENPPDHQDAAIQAAEWMAMGGYDEELLRYLRVLPRSVLVDPLQKGLALHLEAYAQCRLGQIKEAKRLWQQSLKILTHSTTAQANLNELSRPIENAIWPYEMEHWLPRSTVQNLVKLAKSNGSLSGRVPAYLMNLMPVFLDRGDPGLRQLAVAICALDGSKESMELIRQFAFSSRGSDELRYNALRTLKQQGLIDKGPHRFFSKGKFVEVQIKNLEIHDQPKPSRMSHELQQKANKAFQAMNENKLGLAEELYQEILEQIPDCTSSEFNLATVWLHRDEDGEERARKVFEAIHQRDPEYMFAGLALAQLHCKRGEYDRAREKLALYADRERMHVSEAKALYSAQAEFALAQGETDDARKLLQILEDLCGDDDSVIALRQKIEMKSSWSMIPNFLKGRFQ